MSECSSTSGQISKQNKTLKTEAVIPRQLVTLLFDTWKSEFFFQAISHPGIALKFISKECLVLDQNKDCLKEFSVGKLFARVVLLLVQSRGGAFLFLKSNCGESEFFPTKILLIKLGILDQFVQCSSLSSLIMHSARCGRPCACSELTGQSADLAWPTLCTKGA